MPINQTLPKALVYIYTRRIVNAIFILLLFNGFVIGQSSLTFDKDFSPSTIGKGAASTLTLTIENLSSSSVDNIAFTDVLPANTSIAFPGNLTSDCNGLLTAADGGNTLSFSNGRLGANSSCTISINVTSNTVGTHTNVTGDLTSDAGNSGSASADLVVSDTRPGFSMSLSPSTISEGSVSTMTLTIDNSAGTSFATGISFFVNLPSGLQIASPSNLSSSCDDFGVPNLSTTSSSLSMFNGSLAAGGICTVTVDVVGTTAGMKPVVSSELNSNSPSSLSSGFASSVLNVTRDFLLKSFIDDPVVAGEEVTLEFRLKNFNRRNSATNISFTDDLDAVVSGMTATSLPADGFCGSGSTISGTSVLTMTGGELDPEADCTFNVTLQVPSTTVGGSYTNTTSSVTYDLDGSATTGNVATDILVVRSAPKITKSFIDDPVAPGDNVTLRFTIENTSLDDMTDIGFIDELSSVFLQDETIPANGFCGASSVIQYIPLSNPPGGFSNEPPRLIITGAELTAQSSCSFDVVLKVPSDVENGTYPNTTTPVTATVNGEGVEGNQASDDLTVLVRPTLIKTFDKAQAVPGNVVNLEFSIQHSDDASSNDYTGIAFDDDLESFLSGLVVESPLPTISCGTLSLNGSNVLSLTNGTLDAGAEPCTFSVELTVPVGTTPARYTNTTSDVSSVSNGLTVSSAGASADLQISPLLFTKEFIDDPALAGGQVTLEFTLDNQSTTDYTGITFLDDLNGTLSGLIASNTPLTDICGTGSSLTGTTNLIFTGGDLSGGSSCTFSVVLDVLSGAAAGCRSSNQSGQ